MFWAWRNSRFTNSAVAFFNSINNNNSNTNNQPGASKKAGYNKLSGGEEASADLKNRNLNLTKTSTHQAESESSSASDLELEEDEFSDDSEYDRRPTRGCECSEHMALGTTDNTEAEGLNVWQSFQDEALTCNVCDRSFSSPRLLSQHQQKKRHFGCSACDSLFHTLMSLEHHKEEFEHWSGDEHMLPPCRHSDESSEETSEELERLL